MALRIRRDRRWERAHLGAVAAATRELARFAALDAASAEEALAPRLADLRRALLASPAHRDRLAARGLGPDDLQTLADLAAFPTLDRATLAARWRDLPAFCGDDDLVVVTSSGSTGTPVPVVRRADESLHMWAIVELFVGRLGLELPPRPRVVLLCALPDAPEYSAHLPLFRDGALHRLSVRAPATARRLAGVAPSVVTGDPESLRWLAEHPVIRPSLIVSSALHLAAGLREALPAPVINLYSTTETGPIAWECPGAGRFHVLLPDVWVESLGGELVVTRLRPGALPLLRYATGDGGDVVRDRCACGHAGLSIVRFRGRSACAFRTEAGAEVDAWQLVPLLRGLSLRDFRITQTAAHDFLAEVALPPDGLATCLAHGLQVLGFAAPAVTVRPVPVAHGAKPEPFRLLVSWSADASR